MLDMAIKYEPQLQGLFCDIAFDDKYKFFSGSCWSEKYVAETSTWNKHEFVSVHNGVVLGYLKYSIDRSNETAYALQIINFSYKDNIQFSKDLYQFLVDIFEKFQFRKLKFCCYVGNPIEKMYDKYIDKFGGRIVGIYKEDTKLIDGNYYDLKEYEILRKDYKKN